ncbi:tRNA uracil 4-sulfurtransferase ThiI [Planctobacterium marinum]|uniref:tRNA sulfurtransferase n=1 Tax=Planctobacterium marinum TaxID=1631968 RepID=A0AA48HLP1_9ALTE|nr:tRNA sulfurtransferase [Planctobacterium marinum]
MRFLVKLHPEITIKSKDVRKRFIRLLESNIRLILGQNHISATIQNQWDKILVNVKSDDSEVCTKVEYLLARIPGVDQILVVQESEYTDLDDIYQQVKAVWHNQLQGKTFAVRVKRKGNQSFTSTEVAAYVGGGLNQFCETGGVKLKNPDVTIHLEIDRNKLILVERKFRGLGGMPLPSQEDVLSLMSGGFDSGVASYQMIRRGAKTHFCFFNLGGREHEIGVREVSHYLWKNYSPSHRVKFIAVDFEPIVADILENVESGYMGVILKRMMLRAASIVADNLQIKGLVTGECLGQVSSQTLSNLHVIDQVTDKLVVRPLICSDKADIIDVARQIGTEDFAKSMPEYCGVISIKPNVKAPLDKVLEQETKCNLALIEQVVSATNVEDIKTLGEKTEREIIAVESSNELQPGEVLLDIRAPAERDHNPLQISHCTIEAMPFYKLAADFGDLDQNRAYYLYCDRGVMSKMQALVLKERGFKNVKVYRP